MSKPKEDPFQILGLADVEDDEFLFSKRASSHSKDHNPLSFFNFDNKKTTTNLKSSSSPPPKCTNNTNNASNHTNGNNSYTNKSSSSSTSHRISTNSTNSTISDKRGTNSSLDNPFSFFSYEVKHQNVSPSNIDENISPSNEDDFDDSMDDFEDSIEDIETPRGTNINSSYPLQNELTHTIQVKNDSSLPLNVPTSSVSANVPSDDEFDDDFQDDDLDDDIIESPSCTTSNISEKSLFQQNRLLKKQLEDMESMVHRLKEKEKRDMNELNKAIELVESNLKAQVTRAELAEKRNRELVLEVQGAHHTIKMQELKIQDLYNRIPGGTNLPNFNPSKMYDMDVDWIQVKERHEFVHDKLNIFQEEAQRMYDIITRNMKSFNDLKVMLQDIERISEAKKKDIRD